MKLAGVAAVLAAALAGAQAQDPKEAIQAQLSSMMQAANSQLSKAEAHHKRAIEKGRRQVTFDLGDASRATSFELGAYAGALVKGEVAMEAALNASKAGLAFDEARPRSPGDWSGPGFDARAKLGALISQSERTLKRGRRARGRAVREREQKAEEAFEGLAEKLGMELGDLTPVADEMKQGLEATVDEIQANFTANSTSTATAAAPKAPKAAAEKAKAPAAAATSQEAEATELIALSKKLEASNKAYADGQKAAGAKIDGFLAKESKVIAEKANAIHEQLGKAEKVEIGKVQSVSMEPLTKQKVKK